MDLISIPCSDDGDCGDIRRNGGTDDRSESSDLPGGQPTINQAEQPAQLYTVVTDELLSVPGGRRSVRFSFALDPM